MIYYGVDGVEIYSELQSEVKKEIIQKIRNITKETNQHIPILYNLSYFRTLIKSIFSVDKSDPSDKSLLDHREINLSENQSIYIFKEKKDVEDFLEKNQQNINKDLIEAEYFTSCKISSTSLPHFANNLNNAYEAKNIENNLSGIEDGVKEFTNFEEKLDKELIVNEENISLTDNNLNNPINIDNNQEAQDLNENAEIIIMLNNLEVFRNKNFIILSTAFEF